MEIFYIKSQRLCGYLMSRGFVLQDMQKSLDHGRNIFMFKHEFGK